LTTLESFALGLRGELVSEGPDARHEIFDVLLVRGSVRDGPEHGLVIGRRNRFDVAMGGKVDLELRYKAGYFSRNSFTASA
jgi:hypothetical protein